MKRALSPSSIKTRYSPFAVCITIILLFITLIIFSVWKVVSDPDVVFLYREHDAAWIRAPLPTELVVRNHHMVVTGFRTRFDVSGKIPEKAMLTLKALKYAAVWIDDKVVFGSGVSRPQDWKKEITIEIASNLSPGSHELRIYVLNDSSHPALIAWCRELSLSTGNHWEASTDNKSWLQAQDVDEITLPRLSYSFPRADHACVSMMYLFFPLFVLVFLSTLFFTRGNRLPELKRIKLAAENIRWILLGLGVMMGLNNLTKIPLYVGMDIFEHMEYVMYVAQNVRLPLATEGWQMFEAPLFYMISAVIYTLCSPFFSEETVWRILRILPLVCGIAQIELCYRTLRDVYPEREDLQILGTATGGFLPMNLYVSQVAGTESLAAFLSAVVVVLLIRLHHFSRLPSWGFFILIGILTGLSVLTKITAFLLIPAVIWSLVYAVYTKCENRGHVTALTLRYIFLVFCVFFLVCGWYFLRNWIEMGQIFVTSSQSELWWQDPGYRTVKQFLTFGQSLFYPVFSGVRGLWDSLYSTMWLDGFLSGKVVYSHRPPWNYNMMLSGTWLSLLPALAILMGAVSILKKPLDSLHKGTLLALFCVIFYLSAILYLFLTIPFWSVAKAKYTMGIIPCFALLGAEGFDILTRVRLMRAMVYGVMTCWVLAVYAAYFVL